jgi:hypothetical protein
LFGARCRYLTAKSTTLDIRIAGMSSRCEVGVDRLALELDYSGAVTKLVSKELDGLFIDLLWTTTSQG